MFISYGNNGGYGNAHVSGIKPDQAAHIMTKCIQIVNELQQLARDYEATCKIISDNWQGGGKQNGSAFYETMKAANDLYATMVEGISYSYDLVNTVEQASNELYQGYDKERILFGWR